MKMIERIASFLSDIVAIVVGVIAIKQNIINSKWAKTLIGAVVGIAGITTLIAMLYFVKAQIHLTKGAVQNTSMNNLGDNNSNTVGNNYGTIVNNNYYAYETGGGNIDNDSFSSRNILDDMDTITGSSNFFARGDIDREREIYSLEEINNGASGDKITFNSIVITDSDYEWYKNATGKEIHVSTITDERNFVGAREDTGKNEGANNVWHGNEIEVEDGKIYFVRLYVDNNGPNGEAGASKNTRVAFYIPEKSDKIISVEGTISSSNASPSKYWDYVNFTSDVPFHLEYDYGSARLENNFFSHTVTANNSYELSDELVTGEDGVLIGYDTMDGIIPGGYEYDCYIGIRVKVVYD